MKKKGLIISTVVMVVVLIASLTTATYAWFTSADSVKVDAINMSVKSSAKVNVGVKFGNGQTYNDYYNGEVTPNGEGNTVSWNPEGAAIGLSSSLTFVGLELGSQKAIGSSTWSGPSWDGTSGKAFDTTTLVLGTTAVPKYVVKAKGDGTTIDYGSAALANANKDYLDAKIGVEANEAGVKGTYVKVKVTTTDSNPTMGINASVHFIIIVDGKYIDVEPFGTVSHTALKSAVKDNTVPSENKGYCTYDNDTKQVTSTFYFWVAKGETDPEHSGQFLDLGTKGSDINDFRILAYIDGADRHCVKDATGGCSIEIEFDGSKDAECAKLGDTAQTAVTAVKFIVPSTSVPA